MAWYPGATRMELQPESDQQAAIRPTQFILHSIAAPWDERRMYEYWRDSTNLESHLGLDFDGSMGQFIGTETKADANAGANRRPDGTGAVSIETASNLEHSDPWTPQQIAALIQLGVWLHRRHGIPLRICRSADDPGFGYHGLHRAWSTSGTACPGPARIRQFREVVFPGIVAAAQGAAPTPTEDDDMTPDELLNAKMPAWSALPDGYVPSVAECLNGAKLSGNGDAQAERVIARVDALAEKVGAPVPVQVDAGAVAAALVADAGFADAVAERVAAKLAARLEA